MFLFSPTFFSFYLDINYLIYHHVRPATRTKQQKLIISLAKLFNFFVLFFVWNESEARQTVRPMINKQTADLYAFIIILPAGRSLVSVAFAIYMTVKLIVVCPKTSKQVHWHYLDTVCKSLL